MTTVAIYNQIECVGSRGFVLCEKHRARFHNRADTICILIDLPNDAEGKPCVMCCSEQH